MKKNLLLFLFCLFCSISIFAQGEIVIGTNIPIGSNFKFYVTRVNDNSKVYVDWGDGTKKEAVLSGWSSNVSTEGVLKNDTIIIYGDFKSLDIEGRKVDVINIKNQPNLTHLSAKDNDLTYEGIDLSGAPNIENIDVRNNKIKRLNLRGLKQLKIFQANSNPELSTVIFEDRSESLNNISMSNCDISHFYPISLSNLQYLDLSNGSLTDLEIGENYPNLLSLNIAGNKFLQNIDVTKLNNLTQLDIANTGISKVNLVNNKDLIMLDITNTAIDELDIRINNKITTLLAANTNIKKIDLSKLSNLQTLNLEKTLVERVDLSSSRFVRDLNLCGTKIQFIDLHAAIGVNRLNKLDIRDCKNMTPQSLNFTFMALPPHNRSSWSTNVFIKGSNSEHSNTNLLKYDDDNYYISDIKGDASASMDSINIVSIPVSGVNYELQQVVNDGNFATWNSIKSKGLPGFPIKIVTKACDNIELIGVKVNDTLIKDSIFVVSTNSTILPIFKTPDSKTYIRLTVPQGVQQQYFLATSSTDEEVKIDWGNGESKPVKIGVKDTLVQGETKGKYVAIYGNVLRADFSSYPHINADNKITSVDLSNTDKLQFLSTYMNKIGRIDISKQKNLKTLDCAYCELSKLDISNNNNLDTLRANGNHISAIDLSNVNKLTYLEINNNELSNLNLEKTPKLITLIASVNKLKDINISQNKMLEVFRISNNEINLLDITNNNELTELDVSKNKLSSLELVNCKKITKLLVNSNKLKTIDLSQQKNLSYLNIGDNSWNACTLNDVYYSLPECKLDNNSGYNLFSRGDETSTYNDALHAESDIAKEKGWRINYEGDGQGCNVSYITIDEPENGILKLYDANDKQILSGTKCTKGTNVKVSATPKAGYELENLTANLLPIKNNVFTVSKATKVTAKFTISADINCIKKSTITIENIVGGLQITSNSPVKVSLYTTSGHLIFSAVVDGNKIINLPSGLYVVKTLEQTKVISIQK